MERRREISPFESSGDVPYLEHIDFLAKHSWPFAEPTPRPFPPRLESFSEVWRGLIVLNNLITTSLVGNRIVGSLKRVSEPAIVTLAGGSGTESHPYNLV